MHVADGPVRVVAERVDRLDRHQRSLERAHAVEGDGHDEQAHDRIGTEFVPGAGERHQAIDHAAPRRHPQHDRECHAERLRPVRQRRVVQVVRARPDVEEDQRPEVHDRQAIRVNGPFDALRDEVVHDAEKAGGQEEADGVVAVPPLRHGILDAGVDDVALRAEQAYRHGCVVDEMQHRDGDDEGEIEPVRHVDVRFTPLRERAEKDEQVRDPDDRQPQVRVPFRLRIFLALRDAKQIAGAGDEDEELIAPDDEPRRPPTGEARVRRALHDIERRRQKNVAAEGKDDRRSVQRPQPTEAGPRQIEIEHRQRQLPRQDVADDEAGNAPDDRRNGCDFDRSIEIACRGRRRLQPPTCASM